jgi:UDP-N-acetylmuramate--alanine ligase
MLSGADVSRESVREILNGISLGKRVRVHFVGIGGVSVCSLARLSMELGVEVSGSDMEDSPRLRELRSLGGSVKITHSAENIRGADLVVYSHAISQDNPELSEARRLSVPTVNRAVYLGSLMTDYGRRIGVSGSHGKSTTTAMLDCIFSRAGLLPTTLSGAELAIGSPYRIGGRQHLIYEACEYRNSFLSFSPTDFVALNLELDHTDYFENIEALSASFAAAMSHPLTRLYINGDDPHLRKITEEIGASAVSFGSYEGNDYRFLPTGFADGGIDMTLYKFSSEVGRFRLNIPGAFNMNNAAAAITVALEYGIDRQTVAEAIESFSGIPGRLEYIGTRYGRPVYYDYAHHPTEITAGINAIKELTLMPLTVIFKPHTFSRTRDMWREFVAALSLADYPILTDIFPAREQAIEGVSSELLAKDMGGSAKYCSDNNISDYLDLHTEGAIVLMGAGDFKEIRNNLVKGP